ncbi:hypothetical protein BDV36DRAFT_247220 [Aspergillus pseudocaelatus]|uniref:Uncharacterized protein n=1 Tax=Aspergillus pseudocaelatus TaxID=1825620 RepID=A0ABQ6WX35_9EURO|nr:hypothetical protein BDV36DRAFT_247220 [Aspergillus pseudocaelatus]
MKIIVNPNRGRITRIADWADVRVLPFGMSLWGFQNMLGIMDSKDWHYFEDSSRMNSPF